MCHTNFFIMEWSQANVLNFIDLYKNHKVLWCAKHAKHYSKIDRKDAWEKIALKMGTTAEECKQKMSTLMSGMRREKAKIKKNFKLGKHGPDQAYESSWFAFNSLKFIWDKDTPKTAVNNNIIPNEQETAEIQDDPNTDDINRVSLPLPTSILPKKRKRSYDRNHDKSFTHLPMTETNDELQDFGNIVAKKLRRYNFLTQSVIQKEIMEIFLNADRGLYEQNQYSDLPMSRNQYPRYNLPENLYFNRRSQFSQSMYKNYSNSVPPPSESPSHSSVSGTSTPLTSPNLVASPVSHVASTSLSNVAVKEEFDLQD